MLANMFEQLIPRFSQKIAVRTEDGGLTYEQLNRSANQVGHAILAGFREDRANGGPAAAGLLFEHGTGMIVGLMGALKTGLIYVPLDPTYPEKRLAYMIENSGAGLIVTNTQNYEQAQRIAIRADGTHLPIVCIDRIPAGTPDTNLGVEIRDDAIAYILYTSGSTGRPKGVYQNHRNIWHFIKGYTDDLKLTSADRLTLLSVFCHDAAVMDIYSGLLNGATLYPVSMKTKSMDQMAEWLIREKITVWHSVPTVYRFLIRSLKGGEAFPDLRLIVLGGEAVLANDVLMFKRFFPHAVFMNLYGQSESSYNSGQFIPADTPFTRVMLGKPTRNTELLVMAETGKRALPLQVGEIVIASPHVACGYWRNPEKTAEVFRDHPTKGRLYRTGDLGKVLVDGNIEFMGRKDFQVKIRGYRIEPAEIESQLLEYPGVKECVVLAKRESEENYILCAFFVADESVSEAGLRNDLAVHLPEYMVPLYFVRLERLPLTPNNKVDRLALMEINPEAACTVEYTAPDDPVEERLVKIWESVLGRERIGTRDDFFRIGGHSLKATQLTARIYREFQVEIPLREIFRDLSTVARMAEYIRNARESVYTAIAPAAEREWYPLSSAQRRLFILQQIEETGTTYNMPSAYTIEGELDVERLKEAFQTLVRRHEALRTSFALIQGEPVQQIHPGLLLPIEVVAAGEEEVRELIGAWIQPFDLRKAPLIRVQLIRLAADRHILIYDMHHIISDGSSKVLLAEELAALYQGTGLPPLRVQYKDFAVWQNELFLSGRIEAQKAFWTNLFTGEIPVLNLPTDDPRPALMTFAGGQVRFSLGKAQTDRWKSFLQQQGVTLYMGLLAAYSVLLARYSGQEDITIGSPIAGRPHVDLERMVGMFVNTLALRNQPAMDKPFTVFLREIRELAVKAYENQDYPFEMLVETVAVQRDLSRNPLFDTLFTLQNMNRNDMSFDGLTWTPLEMSGHTARFDLSLTAFESGQGLEFFFEYRTHLFRPSTIEQMAEHFLNLLEMIPDEPERKIARLPLLTAAERHRLLEEYNDTQRALPEQIIYQQAFEARAAERPDAVALVAEGRPVTYRELNERVNSLAHRLRQLGVGRETVVGLMAHRTLNMMTALLAVIKAGGAYLPIDPGYPGGRTQYMLRDSGASVLLTEKRCAGLPVLSGGIEDIFGTPPKPALSFDFAGEVVFLDEEALYQGDRSNPAAVNQPQDMLYLIYTSGSTGLPKGTVLEHRSVMNFITGILDEIPMGRDTAVLSLTTISFDIFVLETLVPLACGGKVVLAAEEEQRDPRLAARLMTEHGVRLAQFTPSRLRMFLETPSAPGALAALREICVGGEAFPESLLQRLKEVSGARIYNLYGPTETTVWSTISDLTHLRRVNIGKPIANTRIYLLDSQLQLVPEKVSGELFIAGSGLARGYYQRPELTEERFLPDPFRPDERMYRTGDLARWLPGGVIEYIGRKDYQVKIRGYRIELGEIERQLLEYPGVKEAVVLAKHAEGDDFLAAFVVADEAVTEPALRAGLMNRLPDYMVPAWIVRLEEMPLTPNKKIDRGALAAIGLTSAAAENAYTPPSDALEAKLVRIWEELLQRTAVGIHDNFFRIGGHSLRAAQLVARLYREFSVEIPLSEIFQSASTVKGLADFIREAKTSVYAAIGPVGEGELYPLSSAQRRLFILHQLEAAGTNYNMPSAYIVEGPLDIEKMKLAIGQLVRRHEALRTSFHLPEGEPVQRVHPNPEPEIGYVEAGEEEAKARVREFIRPFDLGRAPLFRVLLIRMSEARHLLVYDMHHIVTDGTSAMILTEELMALYRGETLPALRIQYKDYAVWHNRFLRSEKIHLRERFWQNVFSGELPVLNLPTDHPRTPMMTNEGDYVTCTLPRDGFARFRDCLSGQGATLYMGLLAVYTILLAKYSGQDDIIVGSPVAGRPHADLERMVGVFINTLALRNYPTPEKTFAAYLAEVKASSLQALENQDYPFEMLVDTVGVKRDVTRNPLFDVSFVLQNMERRAVSVDQLRWVPFEQVHTAARFDLTLTAMEEGEERLELHFAYRTGLFERETITRMAQHFLHLLQAAAATPGLPIAGLSMLTEEERTYLLEHYNRTERELPAEPACQRLLEARAEQNPDAVAIRAGGRSITYREFNERVNSLAHHLREMGVGRETVLGLMATRSIEMMTGLFAIVKAGGAYLPIDPEYPMGRVQYMLNDSGARILLTQDALIRERALRSDAPAGTAAEESLIFDGTVLSLDRPELYTGPGENPVLINEPGDMLYLIYTSGSTGLPKGTVLEHRSVMNFIAGTGDRIDFRPDKAVLSLTTISFDIFVLETWLPLACGSTVVLATEDEQKDPRLAAQLIHRHQVKIAQLTPSRLQIFLEHPEARAALGELEEICVGGEAFPETLLHRLREATGAHIYNMYGPTETTVWSTVADLTEAERVHIGSPIANTRIYLLDSAYSPVPERVAGELYIAGQGLARGYYGQPGLTAERFLPDPFVPGARMYRTGDLARRLPDGVIEYVGRTDQQVKIRGYRIETGEIEALLDRFPGIRGSAVTAGKGENGFQYLAAYYAADAEIPVSELRGYLMRSLPEYMVPGIYVHLPQLPLTPNGKINRQALPGVDGARQVLLDEYMAPETETEKWIAGVWAEMLKVERVGLHDNFFDLGGNSLLLVQLHGRLEERFPGRVSVVDLFAYPTVSRLTGFIESGHAQHTEAARQAQAYWDQEFRRPYSLLILPAEYTAADGKDVRGMDYRHQLPASTLTVLSRIAEGYGVDLTDIFTSLYLYLFAEISGAEEMTVETDLKGQRFPLRARLTEIGDLSELFTLVRAKYESARKFAGYPVPYLPERVEGGRMVPLITREGGRVLENAVILRLTEERDTVTFNWHYDEARLNGDQIEGLIKGYLTFIDLLAREYLHGPEQS